MKKAVIFDLDGTLVNSIPFHFKIHKAVFKDHGINLTKSFFEEKCNGSSPRDFYRTIMKHNKIPESEFDNLFNKNLKTRDKHQRKHLHEIKVFPGVKSTLKKLKKEGYKIAVASSSSHKYVTTILKNNNIASYFDHIVGGDEVVKTKPDPHIFLLARKELNIPKNNCVIVEDAKNGVLAAKNAKIDCLCMLTSEKEEDIPKYATIVPKHSLLFNVISEM